MPGKQTILALTTLAITCIILAYIFSPVNKRLQFPDFEFSGQSMCGKTILLTTFPTENPDKNNQIFFVESAPSQRKLKGRLTCAFESALSFGNLPVKLIYRSKSFKIDSPAFCSLFDRYYPDKLNVYYADLDELFRDTPIEGITERLDLKSKIINVQISDLMRGALLYKYGGFYLDHDVLTLADLRGIRNVIVMDNVTT